MPWATGAPTQSALCIESKRYFGGARNGEIKLSQRGAANALNGHRNTVGPWFCALQERGLIGRKRCVGAMTRKAVGA